MTLQDRLLDFARLGHRLVGRIDAVASGGGALGGLAALPARSRGLLGDDWGLHGVRWPKFPLHGQGTYRVRAAIVRLPAEAVAAVLPDGLVLGTPGENGLHPLVLFFGRQVDVRPNISPLPGWNYHEAVVAVPDVYAPAKASAYQGPFAYMPRLWLDRVAPVLAGVSGYGYAKTLARIEETDARFTVHGGAGPPLADATFKAAGAAGRPRNFAAWTAIQRLLDQPLLAEPGAGVEIGSVLSFRTQSIQRVAPLQARIVLSPNAVPGFAGGTFDATGLDALPAAFEMESHWRITPPMPRAWLTPALPKHAPLPPVTPEPPELAWFKPSRRRIAVLGGGVGAMTAVWALTQQPDWRDLYDITVYQSGWRLGGKGASGRNATRGQRIEEHGLHIWAGFYENAFRMMHEVYAELGRPPGAPLARIVDAFKPHELITLEDDSGGVWDSWTMPTLPGFGVPGEGDPLLPRNPLEYLPKLLKALTGLLPHAAPEVRAALATLPARHRPDLRASVTAAAASGHATTGDASALDDLHAVGAHAAQAGPQRAVQLVAALRLVRAAQSPSSLDHAVAAPERSARRAALLLDLGLATARGMLADGLVLRGFAAADNEEWRDWLRRHGARPQTLVSPVVRSTYDYVFGFAGGDTTRGSLAAGTTTHGLLRLMLTYRGSFFWAMQAGMGDTVFAPLYTVLRRRGVNFKFFHRVERLGLTDHKREIQCIDIAVQARPLGDEYEPLVQVAGLDCWPSEPLYDSLQESACLRDSGADLEHDNGPLTAPLTLRRGTHFDAVVLGISLGALAPICAELAAAAPRWRTMLDKVRTVATLGVQLWFDGTLADLGWKKGQTLATAYAEPLDTWADMPWLLPRETWGVERRPGSVIYLCGPLADSAGTGDKAGEQRIAQTVARDWLAAHSGHLWPNVSNADGALDHAALFAPNGGAPSERFAAQYFRANTRGSERYVQTVPGATQARLRPSESGFDNLVLAGDWVRSGMNAGCVEAAAMGGLAAAAAISHRAIDIVDGEDIPLAGSLLGSAVGTVHGVAHTEAIVVLASLPLDAARALLPPGIDLAAQVLTPEGEATVAIILARHRDVRLNLLPFGVGFRELMVLVPSTRPSGQGARYALPGPYAYVARHIIDSPLLAGLGRALYGDGGRLGRFSTAVAGTATVRSAAGARLMSLTATPAGETVPVASFRHAGIVEWLLGRPLLGRNPVGGWRVSRLDYRLDHARIQAISITVDTCPALRLRRGEAPWRLRSGQSGVIGAFRLWTETTRSNPMLGLRRRPD